MRWTVIGDGGMGTACAILLAQKPEHEVTLWCQFDANCQQLAADRENRRYLPGVPIPDRLRLTSDIAAGQNADGFVLAVPTIYLRSVLERWKSGWPADPPIVSVIKGLEQQTFLAPSRIISAMLGDVSVVALTGPSHAEELARGLPTSVVAACGDLRLAEKVQQWFTTQRFRVYTSPDLLGCELAGAIKNVMAIAAGIGDGLQLGDNTKSALMTRGLVEMIRLGTALGAEADTFYGLAGLGDLITTCCSKHSRNRRVGERIGAGESLTQILASSTAVAEGVWTTRSVHQWAEERGLDLPVAGETYRILYEGKDPLTAVDDLMRRPVKSERSI